MDLLYMWAWRNEKICSQNRAMELLRRNKTLPTTSPTHGKFSRAASYYDWVKGAIWDAQDEWRDQSRVGRYKIAVGEHNRPFIEVIRERSEYDLPLISAFMDRTPGLLHWEHDTLCVEAFCESAHNILDGPDQERRQDSQSSHLDEPKAWVSDRNYWLCRDGMAQERLYGSVLSRLELYQFLRRERFRLNSAGEMIGPSRQLHITNPDGASVLAILRTAPYPHVDGLRDLLSNYISSSPAPNLSLRVSDFWHASFVINFNLPFFAIGPSRRQDKRVFYTSNHKFRARYPLDSLNLQDPRSRLGNGQNFSFQDKLVLHEAVYALTATGPSEPHWTVYCFDEDFFEEEDNEDDDGDEGDEESDDDDDQSLDVSVDPIINEPELKEPMNMWLPRQYCLAALAKQLDKILGYHSHVHEVFKHNLEVYMSSTREGSSETVYPSVKPAWKGFPELLGKVIFCNLKLIEAVDDFLEKDVQVSLDGAPLGALWKSLRGDTKAMKSLRYIKDCLNRLRATGGKLEQIKESFEELRREKKFDHADEQKDRDKRNQEFTIAAFVSLALT
ncbi:hypothetical protein HZS61_001434 [Fusarium oxysporum f. sp. conglutinans]|uniref:Uncharacterized protein n=1 Tax=Fusarium oxysporum f. sp. conglutinans TaxID=100902 RepID=A0A8H6H6N8_FUSOX|nr:hypothetical protein HZS61_001434 [Fusarium oxysporum f. sp. conglutinans]